MKKKRVINAAQLPMRIPVTQTIVACLLMDRLNAPGWVYGAVAAVFAIWLAGALIHVLWVQQPVSLKELINE